MKLCSLVLTPIWLLFYIITTFYEERRLEEEFGNEYREYKKRVRRIIPLIY
jgi:protein-S-isoprenylcysteine O-methyltransferase Ste14